ncbi:MAG: DNA internalization-related competence protein ComEC/Rec2 [Desulfobacteraceae bacterium]|nr:MAG: DNA internalization-related competence protein ComEC/Rec2 [Desulfobacteraceae bacterium]
MKQLKLTRILSFTSFAESTAWNRPAIPLLISLIFGILIGNARPGSIVVISIAAILTMCSILLSIIRKRPAIVSPVLLFLFLGYLSIQPWKETNLPSSHVIHHADEKKKIIAGIVLTAPVSENHRSRFTLETKTIGHGKNQSHITGKLRVTVSGEIPDLRAGDAVALKGKIRPIRNFNNPGGFDYRSHMAFSGVHAGIYTRGDQLQILEHGQIIKPFLIIESLQKTISNHMDRSISGEPQQILKALLLGDRFAVSDDLRESFNRSGVAHILAISGLHIGIIASAAFFLFTGILSRFSFLLWKARVQKTAALLSILPILFYGLLAGMSPSTQRAVIMVILFLMTFPMEKEHELINTISLAALLILVCFPPALFSISFQLSFSAVLSIVYGLSKIDLSPADRPNRWKAFRRKFLLFFLVSFFATVGTMPIVLYYFNQISLIGLFSNLIAIPAIGFIVLPLGFLSIMLLPASPVLSSLCIQGCDFVLSLTIDIIHFLADLPFAAIKTITPSILEICCIYILYGCLLNLIGRKPAQENLQDSPLRKKTVQLITGITIVILTADVLYWVHTRFLHDDLRVHILDVGQGNAALLEIPNGHTMLIDGGGFANNAIFDMGERVVAPFLWNKKIGTIDTVFLSHPNSDHMNGLIFIARYFHVKTFCSTDDQASSQSFLELQQTISEKGIHHPSFQELPAIQEINGVTIQILYPERSLDGSKDQQTDLNNNSLVLKITFKDRSFLFPGDVMATGEKELVANHGRGIQSTVLVAPHHGSKTSSSTSFLNTVDPEYIVISCGWKNRFGMPHQTVLNRYADLGCRVYRTDEDGCVSMTTDGTTINSN